jgi:hypothetical protein
VPRQIPPPPEATTFALRATELRALPDGRFEIVLELTPKAQRPQPDQKGSSKRSEALTRAS